MSNTTKIQGLTCPNCSGVVPVPEGARIVKCPYCNMSSLVHGDRGIRRWHVTNRLDRPAAMEQVKEFFTGLDKARDLDDKAEIAELFLVYLPYWQVNAFVAGWLFGRVKSGDDETKPVEVEVMEEMEWNDAATDVSEFGVHRVNVTHQDLEPYAAESLHAEGMVFEPVESRSNALEEAMLHFIHRGQSKRSLKQKYFEKFHILRQRLSLVYYPLWVARYRYRNRGYQVVVDGVEGKVLYGKAPGNIFYRAAMLVGGVAAGTFILVNGTLITGLIISNSDDSDGIGILLLPIAIGIALVVAGYRRFRYGEEVEKIQKSARKLALGRRSTSGGLLAGSFSTIVQELAKMDTRQNR
jgi:hypothetical protein